VSEPEEQKVRGLEAIAVYSGLAYLNLEALAWLLDLIGAL
jgi:hypothetical protein